MKLLPSRLRPEFFISALRGKVRQLLKYYNVPWFSSLFSIVVMLWNDTLTTPVLRWISKNITWKVDLVSRMIWCVVATLLPFSSFSASSPSDFLLRRNIYKQWLSSPPWAKRNYPKQLLHDVFSNQILSCFLHCLTTFHSTLMLACKIVKRPKAPKRGNLTSWAFHLMYMLSPTLCPFVSLILLLLV